MARPRRLFGPLTYLTLALGLLACGYSTYIVQRPKIEAWLDIRRAGERLGSADPEVRESAAQVLARSPPEVARPFFAAMLGDRRPDVRAQGIRALLPFREDLGSLSRMLGDAALDPAIVVRLEAAKGFVVVASGLGGRPGASSTADDPRESFFRAIRSLLADFSPAVRLAAVGSLRACLRDDQAVAMLESAANDPDRAVRLAAIEGLYAIRGHNSRAVDRALLALIADPGPQVDREACVAILRGSGGETAGAAALALAALLGSRDDAVRVDALQCLRVIGPRAAAALPALEAIFEDPEDQARPIAVDAILAIVPEGSPRALDLRLAVIGDPGLLFDLRASTLQALRSAGPAQLQSASKILLGQLADPDRDVRLQALQLLGAVIEDGPVPGPGPQAPAPAR